MLVDTYINLNKGCVSVRSRESEDYGRVVAHRPKIHVSDVEFVVQPSGRQRARESGVRNVHAFVRGNWDESQKIVSGQSVTYNPFEYDQFVHAETERPVESADHAAVTSEGVWAVGVSYIE